MSADNWGTCPQCVKNLAKDERFARIKVGQCYGHVPAEVYGNMLGEVEEKYRTHAKTYDDPGLREDYSVETDADGIFSVSYSCRCAACGFSFRFTRKIDVFTGKDVAGS